MRRGLWLALGGAAWIGGCSWIPFMGGSDGPHLTNAAVEACRAKADDLGYDDPSERESRPLGEGRYSVVLEVRENEGFGQVTCRYDQAKGAELPPPQPAGKPAQPPAETAPLIAPAPPPAK